MGMKLTTLQLRRIIREEIGLSEDMKNVGGEHEDTVGGAVVIRKMHDVPGVLEAAKELMSTPKAVGALSRKLDLRGLYGYILDSAGFKMTGEGKNPAARALGEVLGYIGTSSRNLADEISSRELSA